MHSEGTGGRAPTSAAHDMFDVMFQAAEMVSGFWQPVLKGVGRWQLEVSQLAAKQTRAGVTLSHRLLKCHTPDAVSEAYRAYWNEISGFYSDASANIASAMAKSVPSAAVLEMPSSRRREHDTLTIHDSLEPQRHVA